MHVMRFQLHFRKVSDNLLRDGRVFTVCQEMGGGGTRAPQLQLQCEKFHLYDRRSRQNKQM